MDEKMLKKLQRQLLWTRVLSVIGCLLMVVVLIGGFLFYQKTQEYEWQLKKYDEDIKEHTEEIEAAVKQMALLDMDVLNDTLKETLKAIQAVDWEMLNDNIDNVDWTKLSQQLSQLDVKAINAAIDGLDTEELTQALENLNNGVDKLKKAIEVLNTIGDKIGGYFK
ncbi:MAG: hypothetical protein IKK33_11070 [Lachnospiraceae bacterium]|nr:hypothetical protein [Lachnospiraceae bacterium]